MKLHVKMAIAAAVILLVVIVFHHAVPRRLSVPHNRLVPSMPAIAATQEKVVVRSAQTSSVCAVSNVPSAGGFGDADYRGREVSRLARRGVVERRTAVERAEREGWDPGRETDSESSRLIAIRDGKPYVLITHNRNAGISIAVDQVRNTDSFNLSGTGRTIGLWDAGHALSTHKELAGRVSVMDGPPFWQGHSTHVGGTIGASGVVAIAIGMAPEVRIDSYDWNDDLSEMASRAMAVPGETNKIQVSNHSYGPSTGWAGSSPLRWYGTWGSQESDGFGSYEIEDAELDALCWNAPYYQPFMSSGNDRGDPVPATGELFIYYDGGWRQTTYNSSIHPHADNWDNGGYDTIPVRGSAKNIMTIGCVRDAVSGGTRFLAGATMTSYSSWGPTDDGRVKPDLVANGDLVYSCSSAGNSSYYTLSGSSMSVAAASGGAILLTEYYGRLFTNQNMRASTIKGLMIHSADDLDATGPDYRTGWGLINIAGACEHLRRHAAFPELGLLREDSLSNTNTLDSFHFTWTNSGPIRVTLCWTDPAGIPLTGLDNPAPRIVNDLDLRVIDPLGSTNFPYILDPVHPTNAATTGNNAIDNVEQVRIDSPVAAGSYVVTMAAAGPILGSEQHYSLLIGGVALLPAIQHVPLENTVDEAGPYTIEADVATFYGLQTNSPAVLWNTTGLAGDFATNLMMFVTNNTYRTGLPGLPHGTEVYYYITAGTSNELAAVSPAGAPSELYSFKVVDNVSLQVNGSPVAVGAVLPDYGTTFWPSGNVVHASAELYDMPVNGHRHRCKGWMGLGNVPAMGSSNSISFTISTFASLMWRWADQYAIAQTSTLARVIDTQTWWNAASSGTTVTARIMVVVASTNYCFAEWRLDGVRVHDGSGISINPLTGILMDTGRTAVAGYLPEGLDADADGLPDWWEVFYFGSTDVMPGGDEDGDGFTNIQEYLDHTNPRDTGATPSPPVIFGVPPANPMSNPAPWSIVAAITDNYSVVSATLFWRKNAEPTNCQSAMAIGGVTGIYTGTIPAPGTNGDSFECWVCASDSAGNMTTSTVYSFGVAYPVQSVSPAPLPRIGLLSGTSTNITITLANSGLADLVWRLIPVAAGLGDDVESGTNQWTHSGGNDTWHITSRRSSSPGRSWYCGVESSGLYLNSMDASLVSPPVHLAASSVLTFNHWPRTEVDGELSGHSWDGGIVEVSVDGGASFEQVTPAGGYNYLITPNPASPFDPETPCFGGTGEWMKATFDLSSYDGKTALVRFRFGSDAYVVDEGWYIDDVVVGPQTGTNNWLNVSPMNGVLTAGGTTNIVLTLDSAGLLNGSVVVVFLNLFSNDPISPASNIPVVLKVGTPPEVTCQFAAQTSINGEGRVTISNTVSGSDSSDLMLEVMFSTDIGASWDPASVHGAVASYGSVAVSNSGSWQVHGITAWNGALLVTNRVSVVWDTTNNGLGTQLFTNVLIRTRTSDGFFLSTAVTSQPFMVDNEPPGVPTGPDCLTHLAGVWSTNNVVSVSWLNHATDGYGGGLSGYGYAFTNLLWAGAPVTVMATEKQMTSSQLADGSNWWLRIRAVDIFGNAGAVTGAGPYWIDAQPPAGGAATVTVQHSAFGSYIVGSTVITGVWSGFVDAGSGIAGYYYSPADGGSSTGGWWTTVMTGTIADLVMNSTNRLFVWAKDNMGHIGGAASGSVLVLTPEGDWDRDLELNGQEEVVGSDAMNPASVFKVTGVGEERPAEGYCFRLVWSGVAGRLYTAYYADLLDDPWKVDALYSNVLSAGGTMIYTNTAPVSNRFFRIRVTLP